MAIGKTNAQVGVSSDMKFYTSVADLGLTVGSATISAAWSAMADNSVLICARTDFASTEYPPAISLYGFIIIIKHSFLGRVLWFAKDGNVPDYYMGLNGSNVPNGTWRQSTKLIRYTSTSFSTLPQTFTSIEGVTAQSVVLNSVLSNPAAQTGDWTITTANNSITVSGTISGTTTITLTLGEV